MRFNRKFFALIMSLLCCSGAALPVTALARQAPGAGNSTKQAGKEAEMIRPSDLFTDFPALEWGMSLREAKEAVEKAGARPLVSRSDENQFTWDGKFGGTDGRATVIFNEGSGIREIAVIVYAGGARREVFERLSGKIAERHGDAKETSDTDIVTSKVWRLKNGFVIESRLLKDDDSPVVDVHWVKD